MICLNCKKQIDDDSNFCKYCGSKVVVANKCPHCGSIPLPEDAKFCPDCGKAIVNQEKNKVVIPRNARVKIQKMIHKYKDGYKHYVQTGIVKQYSPSLPDKECLVLLSYKTQIVHYNYLYKKAVVILRNSQNAKEYGKLIKNGLYPPFSHKLTIDQLKTIVNTPSPFVSQYLAKNT